MNDEAPRIPLLARRILTLERKAEFLQERLDAGNGSPGALNYDREELAAIQAAILALRYHRQALDGLAAPLDALRKLVSALDLESKRPGDEPEPLVDVALQEARNTIAYFSGEPLPRVG